MHTALHWFPFDPAFHRFALGPVFDWLALGPVLDWLAPGLVLVVALGAGLCAHELLHVVPLRFTDAGYTVTVLPDADAPSPAGWTTLQHALGGSLVRVEVTHLPAATPDWVLRAAALLPLLLAVPLGLVAAGVLPNPFATGDRVAAAALVAVTACGLPSPADWAVVWHGSELYSGE